MKRLFIAALCLGLGLSVAPLPVAAADSPDDIAALMMDGTTYFKKGMSALDDAERHWRLGNTSQICGSLAQAYEAFTRAWHDEQRVRSDVIDQGLMTGEQAATAREWIDTFESQIAPIGEKMRRYGADARCT